MTSPFHTHVCKCRVCGRQLEPTHFPSAKGRKLPPLTEPERRKFQDMVGRLIAVIDFRIEELEDAIQVCVGDRRHNDDGKISGTLKHHYGQQLSYLDRRKSLDWLFKILGQYKVQRVQDTDIYEYD